MSNNISSVLIVKCPICGKPVEWVDANPFRPFCCERCKLIDLGQWAEERYSISIDSDNYQADEE